VREGGGVRGVFDSRYEMEVRLVRVLVLLWWSRECPISIWWLRMYMSVAIRCTAISRVVISELNGFAD
jgi:hypothetical protein